MDLKEIDLIFLALHFFNKYETTSNNTNNKKFNFIEAGIK